MPYKAERFLGCPDCGGTVTTQDEACPNCGKKFDKDSRFKCPSCGKLIARRWRKCPSCEADLTVEPETIAAGPVGKRAAEAPEIGEESPETPVPPPERPPAVEEALAEGKEPEPPLGPVATDEAVVPEPSPKVAPKVTTRKLAGSRPCPTCGSSVPRNFQKCPVCHGNMPQPPSPPTPKGPELGPARLDQSIRRAGEESAKTSKMRKLKSAKVTTISPSQASSRGLTNGVGQTNGLGKANGTGSSKGGAFVNGTGVSSAARSGEPPRRSGPTARWKFVVVLVALVIVIPTFILLSYSNHGDRFAIDGSFTDWTGIPRYGAESESTVASANIVEWSVDAQGPDLYLYLKTQAAMMSSQNPESMYLFVDSDGVNSTGYAVETIGADYLLQLTGWGSSVNLSALLKYPSGSDRSNWNAWTQIGSPTSAVRQDQLEARAVLPSALADAAKFILVSKDSSDAGSVSHVAPIKGGLLIVEQTPSTTAATGIVPKSNSVAMLTLALSCEGTSGRVEQLNAVVSGATVLTIPDLPISLSPGETKIVFVSVDTSASGTGQCVSTGLLASGVDSSFSEVEISGSAVRAYADSAPNGIVIDGAFADWEGRLSVDQDIKPVADPDLDINLVGNANISQNSYFFVSVKGEICNGTFVPALVARPSGAGGGGAVVPARRTAEDSLIVYIDSDRSSSTGEQVSLDSKQIGADQKIVVKGLFGAITSKKIYTYSSGSWTESPSAVQAVKDEQRIEIGVAAASIGGSSSIDFIIETTSWKGRVDLATFNPNYMASSTRAWIVDPTTTSPYATSMSYQRKMIYDGVNCWSFFFDGSNTVYKYSMDSGQTWVDGGRVFSVNGVNETSIWFDASSGTVYAVGDVSIATRTVCVQVGAVNPAAHTIVWAAKDSLLNTSSIAVAGKNTFICKDAAGFLWVLSSNNTVAGNSFQLSAFRSFKPNATGAWVYTGQMLGTPAGLDTIKGSIVPAGNGSDVWAVYTYTGNVAARKYTGLWQPQQSIYAFSGSRLNTNTAPPSVVVDASGVVQVVYGSGRRITGTSAPEIMYSHNYSNQMNFTTSISLDPFIPDQVGDYCPTISLDSSTGDLYALWLRSDSTYTPLTVMGRVFSAGVWSNMTIQTQTNFTKSFLTSIYSAPDMTGICWEWTQNATVPIDVMYDSTAIPEFGGPALTVVGAVMIFLVCSVAARRKGKDRDS